MIFYLHFLLLTSGLSGTSVLLGVYLKYYSDASQAEIGALFMTFPFVCLFIKPLFCSLADKHQAHRDYMIISLLILIIGYIPFVIVPCYPDFYTQSPRVSWYILLTSCYIGNLGLGVAWSLGESLAMNSAQRKNVPYGRLRLMGTISWGVYGYIIGEIEEVSFLPKFMPAFLSLHVSVLIEIILLLLWDKNEFIMVDSSAINEPMNSTKELEIIDNPHELKLAMPVAQQVQRTMSILSTSDMDVDSNLGGSLRMKPRTGATIRDIMLADDIAKQAKNLEQQYSDETRASQGKVMTIDGIKKKIESVTSNHSTLTRDSAMIDNDNRNSSRDSANKNPQILMFKMILAEDGRLIKYLALFTMFGLLLAPMNFVFLSMDDLCKVKGCNFSHLAGSVLISQAASETICFFVLPWILMRVRRSMALFFALLILAARYFFYAYIYYTANISPYWSVLGEWGHGIGYGICATILADVALMFAKQCKLFIPEFRRLGFFSPNVKGNEAKVLAEENAMKMALRATMQAIFAAGLEGLGQGVGSLVCGLVAEAYSYIELWQLMMIIALSTCVIHQLVELTRSKWSDSFKPTKGTKAFEIRSLEHGRKDETTSVSKSTTKQLVANGDCELAKEC